MSSRFVFPTGYFPFGHIACNLWIAFDVLLCTCSIWHMCVISIDRHFTIRFPLKYGCYKTRKYLSVKIILVWVLSFVISSPILIIGITNPDYVFDSNTNACALEHSQFKIYGSILAFYIPLLIIAVTYFFTLKSLKNLMRSKEQSDVVVKRTFSEFLKTACPCVSKKDECKHSNAIINSVIRTDKSAHKAHLKVSKIHMKKCSYDLSSNKIHSCLTTFSSVSNNRSSLIIDYNKRENSAIQSKIKIRNSFQTDDTALFDSWTRITINKVPVQIIRKWKSLNEIFMTETGLTLNSRTVYLSLLGLNTVHFKQKHQQNESTKNSINQLRETSTIDFKSNQRSTQQHEASIISDCTKVDGTMTSFGQKSKIDKNGETYEHKDFQLKHIDEHDEGRKLKQDKFHLKPTGRKNLEINKTCEPKAGEVKNSFLSVNSVAAFSETYSANAQKSIDYQVQTRFFRANNERKAVKVLIIIFVIFIALWTPFFVINILSAFCKCVFITNNLMSFFVWSGYASSMANPIIYTVFNKSFRKAFFDLLTCRTKYNDAKRRKLLLYQIYTHSKRCSTISKQHSHAKFN